MSIFKKYELVQFEDGFYGLKRTRFCIFVDYMSTNIYGNFWSDGDDVNKFCKTNNKDEIESMFNNIHIKHTVLKKLK